MFVLFCIILFTQISRSSVYFMFDFRPLKGLVQELLSHIKGQAPPSADQCRTAAGTSLGHHDRDDPDHGPEGEKEKRQRLEGEFSPSTSQAAPSEKVKEVARNEGGAQDEGVSEWLGEELHADKADQESNLQMVTYDPAVVERTEPELVVLEDSEEDKVVEPESSEKVIELVYAGISTGDFPVKSFT